MKAGEGQILGRAYIYRNLSDKEAPVLADKSDQRGERNRKY